MPATIPTSTVRPQSERNASPTARAPSRRSQREPTPKTTRTGVALRGRIPARPAARIPAATKSSGWRNFCAPRASRKPPGQTRMGFVGNWGGRTRTSNFPVNSRAVCQLTYTPKEPLLILHPRLFRKILQRLLLLDTQLLGERDVRFHVHVSAPAVPLYAMPRDAEFLAMLRPGRNPQHHAFVVERLHLDARAQ